MLRRQWTTVHEEPGGARPVNLTQDHRARTVVDEAEESEKSRTEEIEETSWLDGL